MFQLLRILAVSLMFVFCGHAFAGEPVVSVRVDSFEGIYENGVMIISGIINYSIDGKPYPPCKVVQEEIIRSGQGPFTAFCDDRDHYPAARLRGYESNKPVVDIFIKKTSWWPIDQTITEKPSWSSTSVTIIK